MFFGILIFLDGVTWANLKTLAGAELRSPRNFVRLLVRREWEAQHSKPAESVPTPQRPGIAPSIPPIYHIHQGK